MRPDLIGMLDDCGISNVVMIGTQLDGKGGMSSVAAAYRDGGLFERCGVTYLSPVSEGALPTKLAAAIGALLRFVAMLSTRQVRIVHIHVASGISFWRKAIFASLAYGFAKPVILHVHGGSFAAFFADASPVGKYLIKAIFRRARRVVVLSASWIRQLAPIVDAQRCVVIENPVMPPVGEPPIREDRRPIHFLFLGRLEVDKGAYDLLDAFAKVVGSGSDARLVMAGNGDQTRCREVAEALGVGDKVSFPGWVVGAEKVRFLSAADVFVLPSHIEGLPMAMIEAMSFAIPLVICPVGSIPEALADGQEAIFVPPRNVVALATAMLRLASDPDLRHQMGRRGYGTFARRFSIGSIAPRVEALYREVSHEVI